MLIAMFALGFAGIGLAFASKAANASAYHMAIFMLTLPTLFMSNSLYPLSTMPTWMRIIAQINPITYVNDGIRQLVFQNGSDLGGGNPAPLWLCFVITAAFAAVFMLVAYFVFKKSIK